MTIILLIIAIALFWYFGSFKRKQNNNVDNSAQFNENLVIEEAVTVINDFLNVGSTAHILSCTDEYFTGHICFNPDMRSSPVGTRNAYGFCIYLCSVSDLSAKAQKYPKLLINNPDHAEKYHSFISKYRDCYDPNSKRYVYRTKNTVLLDQTQKDQMRAKLAQQVAARCPLADFEGESLYTKNVMRDWS